MSMHCERCNHTWPGHAEGCGTIRVYHDCPHCGRQETFLEFVERAWVKVIRPVALFTLDVLCAIVLVLVARAVATPLGVDPLALVVATVAVYAIRKGRP